MREHFNRHRKDFRDLLDEYRHVINPFSSWESVKGQMEDDQRYKDFPEKNRVQVFEQHKQFLEQKVKKDFVQFMTDSLTRMAINKLKNQENIDEVMEELTEVFDYKDERFRKMGMYYNDER